MSGLQDVFRTSSAVSADSDRQRIFQELKPRCVFLSKCILTSKPNLRELTTALTELHAALQIVHHDQLNRKLGDYIFFPLSHVFRQYQTINDRSIELALQCVEILIKTCWRVQIERDLARQLLILITFIVGGNPNMEQQNVQGRSEETQLAGCRCLLALFESLERSGETMVDETDAMPAVGHTVSILLTAFAQADMLELQLVVLGVLEKLLLDAVKDEDTRASFYPGVMSGLVKALGLGRTTKIPGKVLREVVKVVDRLVVGVLKDSNVANLPDTDDTGQGNETLKQRRTKEWARSSATNTKVALEQILKLRAHPNLNVRTTVFELSRDLLETCTKSLREAMTVLVETLVVIAGDLDEALASLSENTIRVMAAMQDEVKDAVRSCLDRWIVGLPRVMTGNDEDAKQRFITRLSVAFGLCMELSMESDLLRDMLADGIKESLIAAKSSAKGSGKAVVKTAPERPRIKLLLADRDGASGGNRIAKFPDVMVTQRNQMGTMDNMKQLLESLGRYSENGLTLAQRHIRDASALRLPRDERATSLWIALSLARGPSNLSSELVMYLDYELVETSQLQRNVTDELLAFALSNLTTSVEDEEESAENTTIHCLCLESLSFVAETRKKAFRGELVDALYPVVHHMGSSSPEVQNHAMVALNNIAHACEYSNSKELLMDNVDYMVNAVSLKLNIFDLSPQAPVVLNMMIQLVGPRLIPYMDDLVVSMFSILDGFHEYERLSEELFAVLGAIVEESAKVDEDTKMLEGGATKVDGSRRHWRTKAVSHEELLLLLKNSRDESRPRLEPLDESSFEDDGADKEPEPFPRRPWGKDTSNEEHSPNSDDQHAVPPPEDEAPKPPKSYEIVQRVTRLSQHYLTHGSLSLRTRVLQLVSNAAYTLGTNESEYLPVVNDIWPVVYARLFDEEAPVVITACQAISRIAETAGDFLSTRVRDGWPGIRKVYVQAYANLAKERRLRTSNMGIYGTAYKVWDAVVKMITSLVTHAGAEDEILDEICEVVGGGVLKEREDMRDALQVVVRDTVWLEMENWEESQDWADSSLLPVLEGEEFVQPVF